MGLELRLVLRLFRRRPAFCLAVVATIGVALGAFTAIASLVYALLFEPLPFRQAERVVVVEAVVGQARGRLALREFRELSRDSRLLDGWSAYYRSQYNVTGNGTPAALTCTIGTSTLFDTLGVRPVLGDVWRQEEDFTRQYLVLLSHRLWQQRYGGRHDVVGSKIELDGAPYTVAGVLPRGFDFPVQTDIVRAVTDYNAPHVRRYSVIARLRPNVTIAQAQAELDGFSSQFAAEYPDANTGVRLEAMLLRDAYVGRARPFLWLLLIAAALLLAIACINVTSLLLSHTLSSSGDIAVRLALGAERRHLVRQSVLESLTLATLGAIGGALLARVALQTMSTMVRSNLPPWFRAEIPPAVWLAAAATTVLVAVVVGLVPALEALRTNISSHLRQDANRSAGSMRQQRLRRGLLAGQAAFAALLLVVAGVLVDGLRDLLRLDPGFDSRGVLTFRVDPPFVRYPDIATTSEFYRRAIDSLLSQPGIEAAGTNSVIPFANLDVTSPRVAAEGRTAPGEEPFAHLQIVDPHYFRAMGIPLQRGRGFDRTDDRSALAVAVISARTARRLWSGDDPIGRRLRVVWNQDGTTAGGGTSLSLTVVGIVGDVRFSGIDDELGLDVYAPNTQLFAGDSYFVVRSRTTAGAVERAIRPAIDAVDRDQSVFDVQSIDARIAGVLWQHRVAALALGVFGAIALGLAVFGTYAVTAHTVAASGREIGIRLALGSPSRRLIWLVARRWLLPVFVGVATGLALGAALSEIFGGLLGVAGRPSAAAAGLLPVVLVLASVTACIVPVYRAVITVRLVDVLKDSPPGG